MFRSIWEGAKGFLSAGVGGEEPYCYWGFGIISGLAVVFFVSGIQHKNDPRLLQYLARDVCIYLGIIIVGAFIIDLIKLLFQK